MKFNEIIGHKNEIRKLVSMTDSGQLPHALLFHGPSGTGKMQTALAFIQYLNCTDRRGGDSCGECPSCRQLSKFNNPDVHFIYPVIRRATKPVSTDFIEEWRKYITENPYMPPERWGQEIEAGNAQPMIYVSESDEILRQASLSPYGKGHKVFLIWQPEKMNADTANKLLKVIEEPHEDTLFIMVSNNPGALLPTVRSRLQAIEFGSLSEAEVTAFLESRGVGPDEAMQTARLSKGNLNKALRFSEGKNEMSEFSQNFIEVMRSCYARKITELKGMADSFAGYGREKSMRQLEYFSRMIRESFISNLRQPALQSATREELDFISKFGPFINNQNVEEMIRELDRAYEDISRNANQKIVWFDLFLELTRLIRTKGINK